MVHEAKLHQFIGQMLAKTLSGAPVWPTVLGSVGALSPSAVSWAGRESLKRGSIAREQQVHKSLAILKQRRPRQPRGVPAMRETGWKMRLFGCAGIDRIGFAGGGDSVDQRDVSGQPTGHYNHATRADPANPRPDVFVPGRYWARDHTGWTEPDRPRRVSPGDAAKRRDFVRRAERRAAFQQPRRSDADYLSFSRRRYRSGPRDDDQRSAVFNNAFISPGVTVNITADSCQGVPFPSCFQVPVETPTPLSLDLVGAVTETNSVPQAIDLEMQLSAVDGSLLDFLHSARLAIDLPPGVSVTSDGGFSAVGATPGVPEPSSALLLAAGLGLLAALLRHVKVAAVSAIALVAGIAAAQAAEQIEPNAGNWKTWVIASGRDFRAPPPPNDAGAEIAELKTLAQQRDAAKDLIAYWDVGPPSYRWQEIALDEMMRNALPWQIAVRDFALVHAAVYDAMVAAWDSKYAYNRRRPSEADATLVPVLANPRSPSYPAEHAVAAGAATAVLWYLFPDRAAYFAQKAEEAGRSRVLAGVQYPSDVSAGLELGHKVAAVVIERGKADGTGAKWTGSIPAGPGKWNGTNPVLPQMAMWRTWVLESPSEFRSPPPPAYDSPEKAAELAEIKNFPRTPKTNSAAYFWEYAVGGLRGHQYWAEQINRLALEYRLADDPPRAAHAYALHDIAVIDAGIGCWDGKYTYWAIRPFQLDPEVKSLFPTPNHPSYPAAHGCFSMAQAGILGYLFPRDAAALAALAEEAAESRVWAGIHYRSDIVAGAALGRAVATKVIDRAKKDGSPPP